MKKEERNGIVKQRRRQDDRKEDCHKDGMSRKAEDSVTMNGKGVGDGNGGDGTKS